MNLRNEIEKLNRDRLNIISKELGVKAFRKMNKPDLISYILDNIDEKLIKQVLKQTWWQRNKATIYGLASVLGLGLTIFLYNNPKNPDQEYVDFVKNPVLKKITIEGTSNTEFILTELGFENQLHNLSSKVELDSLSNKFKLSLEGYFFGDIAEFKFSEVGYADIYQTFEYDNSETSTNYIVGNLDFKALETPYIKQMSVSKIEENKVFYEVSIYNPLDSEIVSDSIQVKSFYDGPENCSESTSHYEIQSIVEILDSIDNSSNKLDFQYKQKRTGYRTTHKAHGTIFNMCDSYTLTLNIDSRTILKPRGHTLVYFTIPIWYKLKKPHKKIRFKEVNGIPKMIKIETDSLGFFFLEKAETNFTFSIDLKSKYKITAKLPENKSKIIEKNLSIE